MAYAAEQPYLPRYSNPYQPVSPPPSTASYPPSAASYASSAAAYPSSAAAYPPSSAFPPRAVIDSPAFPQPYYSHYPANSAAPAPAQLHINTIFISGLPDDVKPREIHNLFSRRQGFESCQLKYTGRGEQVVAFATFYSHHAAMATLKALDGATFDHQTGSTLHIELARSNSRRRPRGTGPYTVIDKRAKITNDDQETSSIDGDGGSDEPAGVKNDKSSNKGALVALQSGEAAENVQAASTDQTGDIPPCSTLFIANLGPTCTEEELTKVLSTHDGFQTLKLRGRSGMPVAFADFADVESSTAAMNKLQGSSLESSDRGGMHLEYARSKMRKN